MQKPITLKDAKKELKKNHITFKNLTNYDIKLVANKLIKKEF